MKSPWQSLDWFLNLPNFANFTLRYWLVGLVGKGYINPKLVRALVYLSISQHFRSFFCILIFFRYLLNEHAKKSAIHWWFSDRNMPSVPSGSPSGAWLLNSPQRQSEALCISLHPFKLVFLSDLSDLSDLSVSDSSSLLVLKFPIWFHPALKLTISVIISSQIVECFLRRRSLLIRRGVEELKCFEARYLLTTWATKDTIIDWSL